jgi:hypothetical protein
MHNVFVKAYGGSSRTSRVVRGARLAGVPQGGIAQAVRRCEEIASR